MKSPKPPTNDNPAQSATAGKARRRAVLGAISAAGVVGASSLPDQWSRPVVDHVLLPVHAQTSAGACDLTCTSGIIGEISQTLGTIDTTTAYLIEIAEYHYTDCISTAAGSVSHTSTLYTLLEGPSPTSYSETIVVSSQASFTETGICD